LPCPRGLNFYILIFREMLKKIFFSRTSASKGYYCILRIRGFKFVHVTSLGSLMALPKGID